MFEIGQQVKVLAFDLPAGLPAGDYTGTVRGVQEGHKIVFQVELDQEFGEAHDCDGAVPSGNTTENEPCLNLQKT